MAYAVATNGTVALRVASDGVYAVIGTDYGRCKPTKISTLRFHYDDHVWTIVNVFAPRVLAGNIVYTVVARTTNSFAAFGFIRKGANEYSEIIAGVAGALVTSGEIPFVSGGILLDLESVIYDEVTHIFAVEAVVGSQKIVQRCTVTPQVWGPAVLITVTDSDGLLTDTLYAYQSNGLKRIIYASYNGLDTIIFDITGRPILTVHGKPTSKFGISTDEDANLEVIIMIIDGTYSVVNISEICVGEVVAVSYTKDGRLVVITENGGYFMQTIYLMTIAPPKGHIFVGGNHVRVNIATALIEATDPTTGDTPTSSTTMPSGEFWTVANQTTSYTFVRYGKDGAPISTSSVPVGLSTPDFQSRLTVYGSNLSINGTIYNTSIASAETFGSSLVQNFGNFQMAYNNQNNTVQVHNLPGDSVFLHIYALTVVYACFVDGLNGCIAWVPTASITPGVLAYTLIELTYQKTTDTVGMRTIVPYSTATPSLVDYLTHNNIRYLAMYGDITEVAPAGTVSVYRLNNYFTLGPIVPILVQSYVVGTPVTELRGNGKYLMYATVAAPLGESYTNLLIGDVPAINSAFESILIQGYPNADVGNVRLDRIVYLINNGNVELHMRFVSLLGLQVVTVSGTPTPVVIGTPMWIVAKYFQAPPLDPTFYTIDYPKLLADLATVTYNAGDIASSFFPGGITAFAGAVVSNILYSMRDGVTPAYPGIVTIADVTSGGVPPTVGFTDPIDALTLVTNVPDLTLVSSTVL